MADTADVAAALLERCSTLNVGSPPLLVAYPDVEFTPPASGKYLEVALFWNAPAWVSVADGDISQGLLQITVVWPRNRGEIEPSAIADQIKAHFPKAVRLGPAKVGAAWKSSPIREAAETRIPVTVPWTA